MNIVVRCGGCLTTYKNINCALSFGQFIESVTFKEDQKIGPPKRIVLTDKVYIDGKLFYKIPRGWASAMNIQANLSIKKLEMCKVEHDLRVDMHDNQRVVVNWLLANPFSDDSVARGCGVVTIKMRAGNGKTFVAGAVIKLLARRTLYIVPKKPLALQVGKDLGAVVYKKGLDVSSAKIVVIVINSALKQDSEWFKGFGMIVMDEVHTYCSPVRASIFWKAQAQVLLGMTATTEYKFNGVFKMHVGPVVDVKDLKGFSYDTSTEFKCEARVLRYWGPKNSTHNLRHETTGEVFVHYMYTQFIEDEFRLELLIGELVELFDWRGESGQKHCIYIFGEELDLLKRARAAFEQKLEMRGRKDVADEFGIEFFDGTQKEVETRRVVESGRVLFSTYGYAGTGVSILRMTAILFLTPRKAAMDQILGRILRRGSDMSVPRVCVDLVDMGTCLKWQYEKRLLSYEEYGFEIMSRVVNKRDARENKMRDLIIEYD